MKKLLKRNQAKALEPNESSAAGFIAGTSVWRANTRPDVAKSQLRRIVKQVASSFQFVDSDESSSSQHEGEASAHQLVVCWAADRSVRVAFLFGRATTLDVRVIEASASIDIHPQEADSVAGARVVSQLLTELGNQLRRDDALHLTWQQERAARDARRSDDAKRRPQLPVAELADAHTRQRNSVVNELFSTEVDFVEDVSLILAKFYRPIQEQQLLDDARLHSLFGNIDVLYELHLAFLSSLQSCVVGGGSSDVLARCFLNLMAGGALAHFSAYAVNLPVAEAMIASNFAGCKTASRLLKFLASPQLVAQCDGLSLNALLVKPIQRLCKYSLLLNGIVRHTPANDAAREKLQDAALLLEDLVQRVNARKLSAESRDALQRVAKHIACDSSELAAEYDAALDSGAAELLFDGAVESLLPTEGDNVPRTRPMHLYCLNTALLLCEPIARARSLTMSPRHQALMKLVAVVHWQSSLVLDVRSIGSHAFCFAVHSDAHVWRLATATASLKAQFLDVMLARTAAAQEQQSNIVAAETATSMSVMLSDIHEDAAFAIDLNDVLCAHDVAPDVEPPSALQAPPPLRPPVPSVAPPATLSSSLSHATPPAPPTSPPPPRRAPSKPKSAPPSRAPSSKDLIDSGDLPSVAVPAPIDEPAAAASLSSSPPPSSVPKAEEVPTAAPQVVPIDEAETWRNRFNAVRKRAVVVERRYAQRISHLEAQQQQRQMLDELQEQLAASEKRERHLSSLVDQLRDDLSRLSAPAVGDREPRDTDDLATQLETARSDLRRLEAMLAAKASQFFEIESENHQLRQELAARDRRIAELTPTL